MRHLTGLDLFFWVAGLVGNCILLLVLWRKRRAAMFPIFTVMIAAYICRTIALFFIRRYGGWDAYYYAFWSLAFVDLGLQLAVFFEIATHVFRPTGTWAKDVRSSLLWVLAASVTLAAALTWIDVPVVKTLRQTINLRGNFFASVLISELFVGMVALSLTSGLPFRTHVARIAQGWGALAICGMVIDTFKGHLGVANGTAAVDRLSRLQPWLYMACLTFWIITLAQEAPVPQALPDQLKQQLLSLNAWATDTARLFQPGRRA